MQEERNSRTSLATRIEEGKGILLTLAKWFECQLGNNVLDLGNVGLAHTRKSS